MHDGRREVALIAGGGRGIGRAIAVRFGDEGKAVCVVSRTADELEESAAAVRERGGEALAVVADVRDPEAVDRAFQSAREWAGGLDTLVCAAGQLRGIGPLETTSPNLWWDDLETPLRGASNIVRAALPML